MAQTASKGGVIMERITDPAQGYCETYCKKYGRCFGDPADCMFQNEVKMYEKLAEIEGIVPFDRLIELALADRGGRCVVLPCKIGDVVYTNISIRGDRYRECDKPYPVTVVFCGIGEHSVYFNVKYDNGRIFPFELGDIGKTVFLTPKSEEPAKEWQTHEQAP